MHLLCIMLFALIIFLIMKYSVVYLKPKKKGQFSKQSAVFLDVESAFFWKNMVESQGCADVEVVPVF
jgi:hypothetical protein